jgi:EAL domain-containing protein (putative c-di-GMP-specific phosphodiesterase class I)
MDAHVRTRALLEKDLRAAIGGYDIRPHYQPIVDLKTRRIVGFESLARWYHPMNGLVAPNTFIPLAEELGLMTYCLGNYSAILAEMRRTGQSMFPCRSIFRRRNSATRILRKMS